MASPTARPLEILSLVLDGELFALEAARVREILDLVPVTDVPNSRGFVAGLINVRGKVVPLADLRMLFGMTRCEPTVDTRIVVIETEIAGETTIVGLLSDKVLEVTEVTAAEIEDTPRLGMRWRADLIRCIGRRADDFIIVLDIDRIFANHAGTPSAAQATEHAA